MVSGVSALSEGETLRRTLIDRVKLTIVAALMIGIVGMAASPAGGPSAAVLDVALLGMALWLSRGPAPDPATVPARGTSRGGTLSGNQALLLALALGGAAVLVIAGATSRPLHGLAVAPFAMAAFALSSHNSRDLRSGVLAAAAALLVLSAADDRAGVMTLCAVGLLPLAFSWIAVRQLMTLDQHPHLAPLLANATRRPWSTAVVVRLVVATAVLALLVPSEPPPRLHSGGEGAGAGSDQNLSDQAGARGDEIGGSDGSLDLRSRGKLDSQPVLDVPQGTPTLWQGGYVDSYDGSGWTRTNNPDPAASTYRPLPGSSPLPTGNGVTASEVVRVLVDSAGASSVSELVYSPGPIVGVTAKSGNLYDLGTGSLAMFDRQDPTAPYIVAWRPAGTTSDGTLSKTHPPVSDPRWLQLPTELPTRVRALARTVTAAATTTPDKVSAIEAYLRANEKYQLDSPVPAQGEDAVDAFLFIDHLGFCEQFASAETVMLRTLGIPARVATGYGGDGANGPDGSRTYRNEDAHAWVQVGYAGQRWVNSDPTAGSQLAKSSSASSLIGWLKALWKDITTSAVARRIAAVALAVLALLFWQLSRMLLRRRRGRSAAVTAGVASEAGRAYQRLLDRLAAQDRPRRPTETVRDLLFRLQAPEQDAVARVLEDEWYGRGGPLQPLMVVRAVEILDALAVEQPVGSAP